MTGHGPSLRVNLRGDPGLRLEMLEVVCMTRSSLAVHDHFIVEIDLALVEVGIVQSIGVFTFVFNLHLIMRVGAR